MSDTIPSFFNPELWDEEEQKIWKFFDYKCLKCGRPGDVIHEIVPKSRAPKTWKEFGNRVLLCVECHEWVHWMGAGKVAGLLKLAFARYARDCDDSRSVFCGKIKENYQELLSKFPIGQWKKEIEGEWIDQDE